MTAVRRAPGRATVRCRGCGGEVIVVIDLGAQPAGGAFPRPDAPEDPALPLRLGTCGSCGLAQLADATRPEDDAPDSPSPMSSSTMTAHARRWVSVLLEQGLAGASSRVLAVASHGGHLAPFLAEQGIPADTLEASEARAARLRPIGGRVVTGRLDGPGEPFRGAGPSFDLVIDAYLLAHLNHPRLALQRLAALVAPEGTLVLEFDHLLATVEGGQWDAVRHGHHSYLTLGWVSSELGRLGLAVIDAVPQPVYGGALRVFARRAARPHPGVAELLIRERGAALDRPVGLERLRDAVERARRDVISHLWAGRAAGRRVVGYGAPARAITFLNALGIGPDLLPYVVDRAPAKQGRLIPGVGIPIRPPEVLADDPPDELLVLTWDLAGEVRQALAPVLPRTRFVVAVPRMAEITDTGDLLPGRPSTEAVR